MSSTRISLATLKLFGSLDAETLLALEARVSRRMIEGGTALVREGEFSNELFIVVSGRFVVEKSGCSEPIAEVSAGAPIGEIAFFSGGPRTATVRAIRDSSVVALSRSDFDDISARCPGVWPALTAALAERLANETRKHPATVRSSARPRPRTITLMRAGAGSLPTGFLHQFASSAPAATLFAVSSKADLSAATPIIQSTADTLDIDTLEPKWQTIVMVADHDLTAWTVQAIRQSDDVIFVGDASPPSTADDVRPNALEAFACERHRPAARHLALLHQAGSRPHATAQWLLHRNPGLHHHLTANNSADVHRLWRFLCGDALGFVGCGGGSYSSAHIGVYKAYRERGVRFDFVGGTSGGAAMTAAFAQNMDPDEIDRRVERMFVAGHALSRLTVPRYSLMDHTHFDSHLRAEYGETEIEDLAIPYFAVSTDLDTCSVEVHRRGKLWQAIRASAAIPGLLPPFYTGDGRTLVDGSVLCNVPIDIMHGLKSGPNVVVSFDTEPGPRNVIDYAALPARGDLLMDFIRRPRAGRPAAHSPSSIVMRCLMANRTHYQRYLRESDLVLRPPMPAGMRVLDWRTHTAVVETARRYTHVQLDARSR